MDASPPRTLSSRVAWLAERVAREPAGARGDWLTRFVVLRLLGLVYLMAFLTLVSDAALRAVGVAGALLATAVLLGYANAIVLAVLCALQLSITSVGQTFYGFGWEIQLVETRFLCIFLCPLYDGRPFPRRPPPPVVVWLLRWLAVRIMLGAGLIKLRGDGCGRDLTCLDFHFETQPIPNPISPFFHFLPPWAHRVGVAFNHVGSRSPVEESRRECSKCKHSHRASRARIIYSAGRPTTGHSPRWHFRHASSVAKEPPRP